MIPVEQWKVESNSCPGRSYVVSKMEDGSWACGCVGWTRRLPRCDCRHIWSVGIRAVKVSFGKPEQFSLDFS